MGFIHSGGGQMGFQREEHGHAGDNDQKHGLKRVRFADEQMKVVESGGYTYLCLAATGTAESDANWKVMRIDSVGNKLYADGNENYDNIATDPTSLSYSYT